MNRPLAVAALAFAIAGLVYQALLPVALRAWPATGDEPHYLLAAHSLAFDGDLDLANNYANRDYAAFYPAGFLDPHVRVQPDGAQLLSHDLGLPLLIALPYAAGGRAGVLQFQVVLGALLAAQMALLGYEAAGKWWAGLLGALALALTAPLGLYTFQVYPELAGSLLFLWALRQSLETPAWLASASPSPHSRLKRLALGLALAALPWLSGRYAPLAALLGLVWLGRLGRRQGTRAMLQPSAGLVAAAMGISLFAYLATNYHFFGGPTPSATPAGNAVLTGFADVDAQQIGRGLLGWWLDQHRGLLAFGPALALAFIGLPHVWQRRRWAGLALLAPAALMTLLAAAWGGFYSGWEVSAKFLIVTLPPLAAGVAAVLAGIAGRWRRRAFWPLAAGLLTLSAGQAFIMLADPFVVLHQSPVTIWEQATGLTLRRFFPAAGTRYIEYPPAGEWRAARGPAQTLHQSGPIAELSVGWYRLYAQAQVAGAADPQAIALSVEAYSSEAGLPLFTAAVRARDADSAAGLVSVSVPFFNPYVDRWNYPFYVDVRASGAAEVRLSRLLFEPDPLPTYGIAGLWLAGLALLTLACAPPKQKPAAR
ncbi:MAG: hypothetical protein JNK29_14160 [Anaerolineales bacterium]|nr:hypothetical protein [Anaerolineales bacterium]